MHDLKTNFDKFYDITNNFLDDKLINGNISLYSNKSKMTDAETIALSICQESLSIDSENYFWSKLKSDYSSEFPHLIHITRYNRGRKNLNRYIDLVNERISSELNQGEDAYIVNSIPVPVCKISRKKRVKVCRENFETAPNKGFSIL